MSSWGSDNRAPTRRSARIGIRFSRRARSLITGDMRVIFASFSVWFAEMIIRISDDGAEAVRGHVSALPDDGTGLDDQRHVRGWICEQPDVLQWIAVQHDHIRMSTGRKEIGRAHV